MSRVLKYKPEFSKEELYSIEKAFKLFADRNGMINLNNMVIAMKELKFDENEPVIYDLMAELESENQGSLTYDDFVDRLTEKLQDRERSNTLSVAVETGDNTSDEDLQRLIKSGASNGTDIPYDEFRSIMVKDISLK